MKSKAFLYFTIGQVVSMFGTSLSAFALGVWVFEETQSVLQFTLVTIFITVPSIIIKPVAGALVDRWDRRAVLIGSDALAAVLTVLTVLFVYTDNLTVSYIYFMTIVQTIAVSFQLPASSATIQVLVPAEQFGQASGAVGAAKSISTIVAPLVAGGLFALIGLRGILMIDLVTFVVAVSMLFIIHIPPIKQAANNPLNIASLSKEVWEGWSYIRQQRGFMILAVCSMLVTAIFEIARVLLTPLVLSFSTIDVLGLIMSVAGFGALVGNVIMLIWGGPKRRVVGILGFGFAIAISLMMGGLRPSAFLIGVAVVIVMTGIPIVWGCIEAIWLVKVPPNLIGRVKGTTTMLDSVLATIVLLGSSVLTDALFEPLLAEGGALASSVGAFIGVGVGRGVAFMLILTGGMTLLIVLLATSRRDVRLLEDTLPDIDINAYLNEEAPDSQPITTS